jgi:pimeloyl-ACP methyl ester carboxylesterase
MQTGIAQSGDTSIHYSVRGDGRDTVLLVMGLGGRASDWGERFPQALGSRYRVVTFDNRGTGSSSKPDAAFTLQDMARDAVAVLDAVSAEKAHVVGLSMGGMIAQLLGLHHEERVGRLALVATHFGGPDLVPPSPEVASVLAPPPGTSAEEAMRRAMHLITAPGFAEKNPEAIEELVRLAAAQPTRKAMFIAQFQAILGSDRSEAVRRIRAPVVVIHGDSDPLIPVENGRRLAARIPGARLEILEGCGHMPMWEQPDPLSEKVIAFFG